MVQLYGRSGGEFLVNTVTERTQAGPTMVRLASGGFVLVWAEYDEGIFQASVMKAQIYDPAGARVGGEILVNSSAAYGLVEGVAALPNGGFIVTYATGQVTAQMFDSAGAKTGGEIFVAADPNSPGVRQFNGYSDVAVLASGTIMITWARCSATTATSTPRP
jgi:hypothetical protein